jgi:lysyl-tRNA synthetase class 2
MDTIVRFDQGIKYYVYNCLDIKLRFQFSLAYRKANSKNTLDFFKKLEKVYPVRQGIRIVQTDNGSEYQGFFKQYLKDKGIKQMFICPRCPKIDAYVERANRTWQDAFVDWHVHLAVTDRELFNRELIDHLVWYNTERPHESLGDKSPIDYLITVSPESQKYLTCTNTFKKNIFGKILIMAKSRLESIRQNRIEKLEELKKRGIDPYPPKFDKEDSIENCLNNIYEKVKTAGRIMAKREHGQLTFMDLQDPSGEIQLWFAADDLEKDQYEVVKLLDVGDFLGVIGKVVKTSTGQTSIKVDEFKLLGKALRPLPEKWHGLKDTEERYRKRYLDLLLNPEVRKRFDIRTELVRSIREYLDNLGYSEVETTTLQPLYGGTNARPFQTHLNALDIDMYLRIADELYLKRLVVGGYEKVYEICKDFRNEGMDLSHNPEFTMIEFYEAYADYHRMMDITEGMFKHAAKNIFGKEEMTVHGEPIDLSGKWPRRKMVDVVEEKLRVNIKNATKQELIELANKKEVELDGGESKGELIYKIFDRTVTPMLVEPIWVIDYPIEVSPLSKAHRDKEGWVERFEGYIGGEEICDGWSEIVNPLEQRERFEREQKALQRGKEEAHPLDEDFLEAIEYGMPTLGGIGIGIDRLTMFYTDTWSIKEVILFPLMKPKDESDN